MLADVEATLNEFEVDPQVIADIMTMLDNGREAIDGAEPRELPQVVFGPGPAATDLGTNTAIAHRHVAQALQGMVAGVRGFQHNIHQVAAKATEVDLDSASRLQGLQSATECVAPTTFSGPSQCTLPIPSEEG